MIQNKYIAFSFRLFCFFFTLAGLLVHMDVVDGNLNFRPFMYYTIQSNLLGLVLFGMLAVKTFFDIRENGKTGSAGYYSGFVMVCVIDLLLTLIVYWVLLAPSAFRMDVAFELWSFGNLAAHLIVPLMCLFDYFLFSKPGHMKYRTIYFVLIYPLSYVLVSTIAGLSGYVYRESSVDGSPVRFPYFFIDWDEVGAAGFLYILALVVFFLILSHALYAVDRKRIKRAHVN